MKKSRILATVCALSIGLVATGCSDTSWILKSGSITMPAGVYLYKLMVNAASVEQKAQEAASASSSSSAAASSSASSSLLGSSSSSASSNSAASNPWSQKIDGVSATSWAINQALDNTKALLVVEKECADHKIALSSSEQSTLISQTDSFYSQYESILSKNGVGKTSFERIQTDSSLKSKLFDYYYGKGGSKAVSDSDIASYYTSNFVQVKQIFVAKQDSSGNALSSDKLAAAKAKAQKAFAAAKADPQNFVKLRDTYNEDPGAKTYPDGYVFSKATAKSDNYDQKFVDLAFSLKDGEIGMAESDMGYFIEYKTTPDPKASSFSTEKEAALQEMKGTDFDNYLKSAASGLKIQVNQTVCNRFNPQKLVLS